MSDCTWNTSVSAASNGCCHFDAGVPDSLTSTSSGDTCTRLAPVPFCHRTVAGQEVVHVQLPGDLSRRLRRLLVRRRAGPGDHLHARQRCQLAADFVRDPVGEVLVFGRAEVLERQDRDAFRARGSRREYARPSHKEDPTGGDGHENGRRRDEEACSSRPRALPTARHSPSTLPTPARERTRCPSRTGTGSTDPSPGNA